MGNFSNIIEYAGDWTIYMTKHLMSILICAVTLLQILLTPALAYGIISTSGNISMGGYNLTLLPDLNATGMSGSSSALQITHNASTIELNATGDATISAISYRDLNYTYTVNTSSGVILYSSLNFQANGEPYNILVDRVYNRSATSNSTGWISFNYSNWSGHTFTVYGMPTIQCPIGWCYVGMNYSNKTLLELDNRFTTDNTQGKYNETSQKYETHRTGYKANEGRTVSQKGGYYYYFFRATNVSVAWGAPTAIVLSTGWNLAANFYTARTLAELKADIGANATYMQYYNHSSAAWATADGASVPSGEAFFVYVNATTNWSG